MHQAAAQETLPLLCLVPLVYYYKFICNALKWYTLEYPASHLYFLGIHASLKASVFIKKIQATSELQCNPWKLYHKKVLHNYFIPWHGKYTMAKRDINAAPDGKVWCNIIKYTTAFLCYRLALFSVGMLYFKILVTAYTCLLVVHEASRE